MKRATLEDIIEIRRLAVRKLSGLEGVLSPLEYERLLLVTMQSTASDLNVRIPESLVTVDCIDVIETFERLAPSSLVAHLLILCNLTEVAPWIDKLSAEDRVRSLIFLAEGQSIIDAERLGSQLENVPVFLVRDTGDVVALIDRFESNPYDALKSALNGERVALKFIEGSPS